MFVLRTKINSIVLGKVTGIKEYGVFVALEKNYTGLIHISEISKYYVDDITDYLNVGDYIKVKVLSVNEKKRQANLSIKNINYKVKNYEVSEIKEVGSGFKILEENLKKWINLG
ncbi:MAG TPA: S1 RNA-binding domain-containing protein [Tenericutes bacterium]|nr:S1 RNA-binding domain-containing protein [Mycoplasmatota bacterium]